MDIPEFSNEAAFAKYEIDPNPPTFDQMNGIISHDKVLSAIISECKALDFNTLAKLQEGQTVTRKQLQIIVVEQILTIAKERKLSELTSSLPSGILVTFDGTNHFKLTDELYEAVCNATKLIPQRAIMGANFLNFKAHEIYTKNGNLIDETFVKWDKDKNKCITGYTVSGNNIGIDETITVTGEALSFLSTGIDTRVYFIKNF